jgi:hypothetical protein
MFCPKCGKPEQSPEAFCRGCGMFLPDLDKIKKKEVPAEEHIMVNSFFSLATAIVSSTLAIILYSTLGFRPETHWIVYLVAGFLIAITAWQIQTFIRTRMLKKQIEKMRPKRDDGPDPPVTFERADTAKLLDEANFANAVPTSVTEHTTRHLTKK